MVEVLIAGKRQQGEVVDGDGPKVSNRIKFMLQDLLEMKQNGEFLQVDITLYLSCFHSTKQTQTLLDIIETPYYL